MTGKTLADHSRAYRTRKAERIARMEAALREIATGYAVDAPVIARAALAKSTNI